MRMVRGDLVAWSLRTAKTTARRRARGLALGRGSGRGAVAAAVVLLALIGLPTVAQAPAPFPKPMPSWGFSQRETLTYAVDWRVFPAGTATVHLEQEGALERVVVSGDSQGAINLLFRVSDRFQSAFNRSTGCTQSFTRQIMEGRRQVTSDQRVTGTRTTYDERNLISHIDRHLIATVPPCVTDMLSGIYYTSSQALDVGSVVHLPVVSGDHVSDVTLRAEARETVRTPTTTYHTIRVQVTADSAAVRNRGKLWIWYSDDQQHVPVQMRARLFWGTLTFRLTGIDNK
jgi:hypothetical protein